MLEDKRAGPHQQSRFVVLDGLRGLAALVVVVDHVPSETLRYLLPHRTLAVDFFFVLSGFVLAHAYGLRLSEMRGPALGALGFLRIRLARFWPMLIAAFAMATSLCLIRDIHWNVAPPAHKWIASLAFGLTFLPTPPSLSVYPVPFPLVGPAHSMFFELVANVVFALVAARLTRSSLICWLLASGGLLIWAGLHYGTLDLGWSWLGFEGAFARVLYAFFAGVAAYRLWAAVPAAPVLRTWAAFSALMLVFATPARGTLSAPFEVVAALFIFPALVFLAAGASANGRAGRIFLYAGSLSYGFYLLHGSVSLFLTLALQRLKIDPVSLDVWLVVLVVISAGALTAALHRFYERPFRRWLDTSMAADVSGAWPKWRHPKSDRPAN